MEATTPKQISDFAKEYQQTYLALTQLEAVNKVLLKERDSIIKVYAVQDDDCHWYIIPFEMKDEFHSDLNGLGDDNIYEWEDKYGQYMTGGDLNNIQLYTKIN